MSSNAHQHDDSEPQFDDLIAKVAAKQYGVFAVRQVIALGGNHQLVYRRIRGHQWDRFAPGVLRLRGYAESWHQSMMAAVLGAGPDALASHRAAAWLHKLDGMIGEPEVELSIPRGRKYRRHRSHETTVVLPADIAVVGGVPCTSVLRTLCDLAAVVDFEALERAVECAIRRKDVSFKQLRWRAELLARRGRNGSAQMLKLLRLRGDVRATGSDLETRFVQLLRRAGIPLPERQVQVTRRNGRKAYIDFAYPALKIAIELDGDETHSYLQSPADRARQNDLALLGWTVIRFSYDELVFTPGSVIEQMRIALSLIVG